ncbi:MAG: polysaccharide deacetylase family protein [Pseudohongiella sp.]|nr:polysaccharide deacetylase family protein [Pseudohongiella sp.]
MGIKLFRLFVLAVSLSAALDLVACSPSSSPETALAFPNLSGPFEKTELPIAQPAATDLATYGNAGSNSLAILLQDEQASWLGLAHGLRSVGIPFRVIRDPELALEHNVVLVYPSLTGSNTQPQTLQRLAQHVRAGNTLIAFSVIGGGMPDLFGFGAHTERNNLQSLSFSDVDLTRQFIVDEAEYALNLLGPGQLASGISYHGLKHPAIASYDDGSAAITHNFFASGVATGHAYAIGFDIGHYIQRAYNGRLANITDSYVNDYQPKVDTLLHLLAEIYWQGESNPVQLKSTPHNREFTALITHDVDYIQSLSNALEYAQVEQAQNIPATYFIQAKYVTDYSESLFFTESSRSIVERLVGLGMEIGSHTVAHSNEFKNMEMGTGEERYPDYQPFVQDFQTVRGATVSGELRVSKFLLESLASQRLDSFRPGHLSLPVALPQMLQATGYRFSSSITANEALTHLPYQLMFSREYETESPIFEFPITIEDETSRLGNRLDESIALANKIGRHGGLVNLLIHTDVTDHKLEFEQGFIAEFRDRAWFSSVKDFGNWWIARNSVVVDVIETSNGGRALTLSVDGNINGLSVRVPQNWQLQADSANAYQQGNVLIISELNEHGRFEFEVH